MIQRIQTIWLLISALSSGFLMKGGILNFISKTGQKYSTCFSGIYRFNNISKEVITNLLPLAIVIILILLLSVVSMLLFKKRRIQKILTLIVTVFSICLILILAHSSIIFMKNYNTQLVPGIKMFLPIIILVSTIFAYRGISRDEKLIKSYNRLR